MHRYVVQQHFRDAEDWHYDLMLECSDALVTFSLGVPPDDASKLPTLVRQIGNHRLAYLEHQGEISGGRGWCRIHDSGTLEWIEPPPDACPTAHVGETAHPLHNHIIIRLSGGKLRGTYRLTREPKSGADYWRLRQEPEPSKK
jgi:hypothetical protein